MLSLSPAPETTFPLPLSAYPPAVGGWLDTLRERIGVEPFNAVATGIFVLAIVHTFGAARVAHLAHRVQHAHDARAASEGRPPRPSVRAELLHFLGEVEVIFGLWAMVLLIALTASKGWTTAKHYFNDTVNYTEPLFVVVIMALASTRPVIAFAEAAMRRVSALGAGSPAAWWLTILTIGPLLGSFITEPAAMTICALLLARQFFDLAPSLRLRYATLGLLFVNVSIGGTLTHFAAPPVLMVARPWGWDTPYLIANLGWHSALAVLVSTAVYFVVFRAELRALGGRAPVPDIEAPEESADRAHGELLPIPWWLTAAHLAFMAWTVATAHYPVLFIGGFLIFVGLAKATAAYQSRIELKTPLLVGFFLAGLVVHGGLQAWWIAPTLSGLGEVPLFSVAALLTAFNDNALITYLATLVPDLSEPLKLAVVGGAVTGGGLTVIANAPNPAGQALLARFFGGTVEPLRLFAAALVPTAIATAAALLL